MAKRFCILYPDGSISIISGNISERAQHVEASKQCKRFNKGERNEAELATFGEIQIDLVSFRELT